MTAAQLQQWAEDEQAALWHDLQQDIRSALNGVWSMGCTSRAVRIVRCLQAGQAPTSYNAMPWSLVIGGVYERLIGLARVPMPTIDVEDYDQAVKMMAARGYGLTIDKERAYEATVRAMIREVGSELSS